MIVARAGLHFARTPKAAQLWVRIGVEKPNQRNQTIPISALAALNCPPMKLIDWGLLRAGKCTSWLSFRFQLPQRLSDTNTMNQIKWRRFAAPIASVIKFARTESRCSCYCGPHRNHLTYLKGCGANWIVFRVVRYAANSSHGPLWRNSSRACGQIEWKLGST